MSTQPAITVSRLHKSFWIHARTDATLLSRIADLLPSGSPRNFSRCIRAVSDVSFTLEKGKVMGIIGRNGSGKTTLLRLIATIMPPEKGSVAVQGKLVSLISMQVGSMPRLTVRDNILLSCSLYGMTRAEITDQLPSIVAFAELEDAIDMYPYQLSTGMIQRLAFSIAVHSKPEVLLLDEALSAGDMIFSEKSSKRMQELIGSDATVIIVSHNLKAITQYCDTVLWMDKGEMRAIGDPTKTVQAYKTYCRECSTKKGRPVSRTS